MLRLKRSGEDFQGTLTEKYSVFISRCQCFCIYFGITIKEDKINPARLGAGLDVFKLSFSDYWPLHCLQTGWTSAGT